MYLIGKGHEHMGPGTSMVQRIDWTRADENQLMKASQRGVGCVGLGCVGLGSVPEFADDFRQMTRYRGMGCGCGKCGMGLFDSGFNPSGWGWPEMAIVGLGAYMVLSTVFTTGRAARRIAAIPGERRKSKAAYYRKKAAELSKR